MNSNNNNRNTSNKNGHTTAVDAAYGAIQLGDQRIAADQYLAAFQQRRDDPLRWITFGNFTNIMLASNFTPTDNHLQAMKRLSGPPGINNCVEPSIYRARALYVLGALEERKGLRVDGGGKNAAIKYLQEAVRIAVTTSPAEKQQQVFDFVYKGNGRETEFVTSEKLLNDTRLAAAEVSRRLLIGSLRRLLNHRPPAAPRRKQGGRAISSPPKKIQCPPKKRQKKSVADDLVCPITLELPFDPVTAEDGRVYERNAIMAHFATTARGNRQLKSPITNQNMGSRLFPAPQIKNLIETSIENGFITGDLADIWNKKAKEKKGVEDLLKKAKNGDPKAMVQVGDIYYYGKKGFKLDKRMAYFWFKNAHDAGSVTGTANVGFLLCKGIGVAKCTQQGIMYIALAAERGSNFAAYLLGEALASGRYGLVVDKAEATRWLQSSLKTGGFHDALDDNLKTSAQQMLNRLTTDP